MLKSLLNHDRAALGKTISLIESTHPDHKREVESLFKELPKSTDPFVVGISGTPGVGKSTLIDMLGEELVKKGPLAILTIDPSSHLTGGSILGDKARMEKLVAHKDVYVRPSPSKGVLGGLGPKTAITIDLLSRLNFKTIIVESVGVGQSEIDLAALADLFMVVLAPGGGDDLQGLKRGILEVADLVLINKADQDEALAKETAEFYKSSLQFLKREWPLQVLLSSGFDKTYLFKTLAVIDEARQLGRVNIEQKRKLKDEFMLAAALEDLKQDLLNCDDVVQKLKSVGASYEGFKNLREIIWSHSRISV